MSGGSIAPESLRAVIVDFYDRVVGDSMIGFLFVGKNRQQLIEREWQFVSRMLGDNSVTYEGRSIAQAHRHLRITGGHFERRQQILRETLADHEVRGAVQERWLKHNALLRPQVTTDRGSECRGETPRNSRKVQRKLLFSDKKR